MTDVNSERPGTATRLGSVMDELLNEQDDRPSREIKDGAEFTASEQQALDQQVAEDKVALEAAELEAKNSTGRPLLPGEVHKQCPGCNYERTGTQNSLAITEYRNHMVRHPTHTLFAIGQANETNFHRA